MFKVEFLLLTKMTSKMYFIDESKTRLKRHRPVKSLASFLMLYTEVNFFLKNFLLFLLKLFYFLSQWGAILGHYVSYI